MYQSANQLLCQLLGAIEHGGPKIVVAPHPPCVLINGVLATNVTLAYIDGVPCYFTPTHGQVDVACVEVLDPCDPRCMACPCGETGCRCTCSTSDLADAARLIGATQR